MFEEIIRQLPKYRHHSVSFPIDSNADSLSDADCLSPYYIKGSFGEMTEEDIVFLKNIGICANKTDDLLISTI
jgi:hypothetical protein